MKCPFFVLNFVKYVVKFFLTERTELSGHQAQNVLNQIRAYTYERDDIGERRLGLIAQEVETAIDQLAIDNVVSSKWHQDDINMTSR